MALRHACLASAAALLLSSAHAQAGVDPGERLRGILEGSAQAFGLEAGAVIPALVSVATPPASVLSPEEERVNFEYAEMVDRMEKMGGTVIGRTKKRTPNTGVTPADRVEAGAIRYIVLHASGGATGKPGACENTVSWLLSQNTAAHFMVCRDGRVIRMVKIENIANHIKNNVIDAASVGIETEAGRPDNMNPFVRSDWDPNTYWRMYASMAWLIRAIAKETRLPRDRAHIITHEEADRGLPHAHVDPGPFFQDEVYAEFNTRFPGEAVTPREFLMRLVADDVPPQIWMVSSANGQVEVKDTNSLGVSHIRVWKLDAAGKVGTLMQEWSAPVSGMPPASVKVPLPVEPGSYRVVARDLVGNTSAALVKVPEPDPGTGVASVVGTATLSLLSGPSALAE